MVGFFFYLSYMFIFFIRRLLSYSNIYLKKDFPANLRQRTCSLKLDLTKNILRNITVLIMEIPKIEISL